MQNNEKWPVAVFDDVLTIINGKSQKAVLDDNGKFPIYGSGGVMGYANDYLCPENTTIIGRKGTINNPIYVDTKFWNVDTAFGLCPNKKIDAKFLYYYCRSYNFLKHNKSTTLPSLTKTDLLKIPIPVPAFHEQHRIVSKIDALFERIDKAIEFVQENIKQSERLKGSMLNEVFCKTKGSPYKFGDIVYNLDGKRQPIKASIRAEGKYPYYGASGIIDYVEEYIFEGESLLISEDGANLVVRKYPIAFIADGKYWVNNHAHVVNAKSELTTNKFLVFYFAYSDISDFITGSAQPKLSQKKLNEIIIYLPSLKEQIVIVNKLSELEFNLKQLNSEFNKRLINLQQLKNSILDSAFKNEL